MSSSPACAHDAEKVARVNGVRIAHETLGDPKAPPLLVMGLGLPLIYWDRAFCQLLVDAGFYVIRFDNRDSGRSSRIEDGPTPSLAALVSAYHGHMSAWHGYTLDDMADDAAALLDRLGVGRVHAVGISLGGMIAQQLAVRHPALVLSLASIMSTTGERRVSRPRPRAAAALLSRAPREREAYAAVAPR